MEIKGLTKEEVKKQVELGHVNKTPKPAIKTNRQIICEHVFNLFNAYNFVIAAALIFVKAWTSLFFVVIILSNIVIRVYQEIRSRNMVAKLNLIISPHTKVLRNHQICEIDNESVVLNDILYLETGNQISSDSIVLDKMVEVDESLLTGEADPVMKNVGDHLFSGSFIVSGACYAKVEHVGIDNYATQIADEARNRKPVESELVTTFNKVTKWTSYLVLPLSICMLYLAMGVRHETLATAVINTSTALLGMLPKGLVLLTSVSMAASIVRLGKKDVLVQEMFSIETLSRVDVLCLDKTGTLTQGKMKISQVISLDHQLPFDLDKIMSSYIAQSSDNNATFLTLKDYFGNEKFYQSLNQVPFSSARKWSAQELESIGTIIVGAPEFIVPQFELSDEMKQAQREGARILMVAHHPDFQTFKENIADSTPLAMIVILDPLRDDAKEALEFFQKNDVDIKVISGDNPLTVSALASEAGVIDADRYVDATTLKTDEDLENAILNYNVIGRATPKQKHQMILTLQNHDQKVAMTGDGVNDVLALKDADVSIAMGSGSDAAKQISQFVVINGELSTLIDVVKEGRLDINNVTRSASMYYLKTIYTILIAILTVLLNISYPFIPFQMTLLDNFIEGFPSFMILFERNIDKQKESIGKHALRYSLPNALVIVLNVLIMNFIAPYLSLNQHEVFTILYFSTSFISIHMVYRIYCPINWYRTMVLILDVIGYILATYIFFKWLQLAPLTLVLMKYIVILVVIGFVLSKIISMIVNYYLDRN